MRVLLVAGARPQFVKAAALLPALRARCEVLFVDTGQHSDPRMVRAHFAGLGLEEPDDCLDGEAASRLPPLLERESFDVVVVMGDTDSALAGAQVAAAAGVPIAHVEAGARSGEPDLPEERNRIAIDRVASRLYCSTPAHAANLAGREGVEVVGDVMADVLLARETAIRERSPAGGYGVLTLHRAKSADDAGTISRVLEAASRAGVPIRFPVHPRTARSMGEVPAGIEILEPLPYLDFLGLVAGASFVLTDSGGLQKEAYLLGAPCITLRDATEWGETIDAGWNVLAGTDPDRIVAALANPPRADERPPLYGDGHAAERIAIALTSA